MTNSHYRHDSILLFLQTLVLALSNAVSMLFIYTIGTQTTTDPWLDHSEKLIDLLLAIIYT